jgi:hypothetical protein
VIFYFGLEGLGGLDMESPEEENVTSTILVVAYQCLIVDLGFGRRHKILWVYSRAGRVYYSHSGRRVDFHLGFAFIHIIPSQDPTRLT